MPDCGAVVMAGTVEVNGPAVVLAPEVVHCVSSLTYNGFVRLQLRKKKTDKVIFEGSNKEWRKLQNIRNWGLLWS